MCARREQGAAVFTTAEKGLFGLVAAGAVVGLYALATGLMVLGARAGRDRAATLPGVELDGDAKDLFKAAMAKGLMINVTAGSVVRLEPAMARFLAP